MSTLFLTFFAKNNGKSQKNKRIEKKLRKCVIVARFGATFGAFWGIGRRTFFVFPVTLIFHQNSVGA